MSCSNIKWSERVQNTTAKVFKNRLSIYVRSDDYVARFKNVFNESFKFSPSRCPLTTDFTPVIRWRRLKANSPDQLKGVKVNEEVSKFEKRARAAIRA